MKTAEDAKVAEINIFDLCVSLRSQRLCGEPFGNGLVT